MADAVLTVEQARDAGAAVERSFGLELMEVFAEGLQEAIVAQFQHKMIILRWGRELERLSDRIHRR